MTFAKRLFTAFSAFALCAAMLLGSLSLSFAYTSNTGAGTSTSSFEYFNLNMPELPHGDFDGSLDNYSISLNFDNLSSSDSSTATSQGNTDLTVRGSGMDRYTFTIPFIDGQINDDNSGLNDVQLWNSPRYQNNYGVISQTADGNDTITGHGDDYSISGSSDYSGTVSGSISSTNVYHYRAFSFLGYWYRYCWVLIDTRNQFDASVVGGDSPYLNIYIIGGYPALCVHFNYDGSFIQTSTLNNNGSNRFTLEQNEGKGRFWISDDIALNPASSSFSNVHFITPVFSDKRILYNYLAFLRTQLNTIHSDLTTLTSSMQSSISNQTSAIQNMDAPSAPQPSTSHMMDYFSKESSFSAPNTDEVFSGDIKSGHYWDGVTWWSSKFNDIIVSNQVIVAFTTAMLTLGLAVLIIGRRFSMR